MENNKKKMNKQIKREYSPIFQSYCSGISSIVFTFIKSRETAIALAKTCKTLYTLYKSCIVKGDDNEYLLKFANQESRPDNTFDLFKKQKWFTLNPKEYIADRNEYIERIWKHPLTSCVAELNELFNDNIGFISGSTASLMLLKHFRMRNYERIDKRIKNMKPTHFLPANFAEINDLDVYIVGKQPNLYATNLAILVKEKLEKLFSLGEFDHGYSDPIDIDVKINTNLTSISITENTKGMEDMGLRNKTLIPNPVRLMDIINFKGISSPKDVLCTFDLDCCKIGLFPRIDKNVQLYIVHIVH